MEVTRQNFDDMLPEVLQSIDECCFMAIDCEYSGLAVTDEKDNCFETVEERYHVVRKSATQFLVIQFGLCPFFYDAKKDEFTHKAYNFYTYPRQFGHNAPNVRFLCESSSLDFLASCGFDFNKLIYEGIPYLTISGEEKMRQDYEKKAAYLASEENSTPISVPENLKPFMEETEEKIKRLCSSNITELIVDNLTTYQRKLVFHNIKPKYANTLYFETVVVSDEEEDEEEEGDDDDDETSSNSRSSDEEQNSANNNNSKKLPSSTNGNSKSDKKANKNKKKKKKQQQQNHNNNRNRVLKITKLSQEEQDARNSEKKQMEMNNISKNVGFSKVIRKISESNKIVVGHNMLLDVSHSVHQFIDDLPNTLAEFKVLVQTTFPNLVDTKLLSSSHPFRELIQSTVLGDLVKRVQSDPFKMPVVKTRGKKCKGYDLSDKLHHEAGFDAYITGRCFLGMIQYLGTLQEPKKPRVLPDSPLVMPFLNKLYMMRMLDITYLNISGRDLSPKRDHVFHVTCPEGATMKSIQSLFNPFGNVQMWWRTSTSLFVSLNDKEQSAFVNSNIENKPGFKVIPFTLYQKLQAEKKRPLMSPSPERDEKMSEDLESNVLTKSSSSSSIGLDHQKKRPKTETGNNITSTTTKITEHFPEASWN